MNEPEKVMDTRLPVPYDLDALLELYRDSLDVLNEILAIFREETPGKIDKLERAVGEEQWSLVAHIAHSLANTTGTLRADRGLQLSRATERASRAEEGPRVRELAALLISELGHIAEVIAAYQKRNRT